MRKKVENLLTENLKLSKDIKELNTRLTEEKKKKSTPSRFSKTFFFVVSDSPE